MTETSPCEIIVGVDTHKHTHAAVAINTLGARLGTMTIPVSTTGYRDLWAGSPIRAFGIEGTVCHERKPEGFAELYGR
jgi:transposase